MKVNFVERTILVSAKEIRRAGIPYSREFSNLRQLQRDLPGFAIEVNRPRFPANNPSRGLTYEAMSQRIAQEAPELMDEYLAIRAASGYPAASKWFREHFSPNATMVDLCTRCEAST